ncbi:MAG: hypothetical protein LBC71_03805 [Oscillospiraceae bacterium]|nr:hypothetical protein [Oscillospiraceae bacterium]
MALLLEFMHLPREHPPITENDPDAAPGECVNPACITRSDTYSPRLVSRSGIDRCGYCEKRMEELC